MKITALRRKTEKGRLPESAEALMLIENIGIEGDVNAGRAERQVCLLSKAAGDAREKDGLCSAKFYPNIEIDNIKRSSLAEGDKLRFVDTVLEVESLGKRCYPECRAHKRTGPCSLAKESFFARVLSGGVVRIGDTVVPELIGGL